jgi:AcrR family transcriptional regulator
MSTTVYLDVRSTPPRRRGAAATRAAILAAAKSAFASAGYAGTGLREIAAAAGVNAALVMRYFGSKEKLFGCVVDDSLFVDNLTACPRDRFGRHVMHHIADGPGERFNALPMLIMGSKDPAIRAICIAKLEEKFVRPLGRWIGGDDGEEHAARVLLLLSGFFTYWRVLPLDQISAASDSATRRWMEDGLQSLIPDD